MPAATIRLAMALATVVSLAFFQSDGCGYSPDPKKGEGEPCTRSDECQVGLACRGGVCRGDVDSGPGFDAGDGLPDASFDASADASSSMDAAPEDGSIDASDDASLDASLDAETDATVDAAADDASVTDGG